MATYVTTPYLPNKKKLFLKINNIYKSKIFTNYGKNVRELEIKLQNRFKVKNVIAIANGTLALQIAIRALEIKGEIITSPFSYAATTSSIIWQGSKPIFADIDPKSFNLSIDKIKSSISHKTKAILPVHVFGNPNNVEEIKKISTKFNLKVIYDASHCFDINYKGKSVFNYGDCSVVSFHATKIFHTIEGGAIFTNNNKLAQKIRSIINFGYYNNKIIDVGINGKMNEFEASVGLLHLNDMKKIHLDRKKIYNSYLKKLDKRYFFQSRNIYSTNNYSYFPILFESEKKLIKALKVLKSFNIYPRRYFYPSLNTVKAFNNITICPNSEIVSKKILCLPIFYGLKNLTQLKIIKILNSV